jgi:hypothetical protein
MLRPAREKSNAEQNAPRLQLVGLSSTNPIFPHLTIRSFPMIVLVHSSDGRAVRNKDNVLALYDLMINQKKSEEATANFVSAPYIQDLRHDVSAGEFLGEGPDRIRTADPIPKNSGRSAE